jgi:hypothetical protein
MSHSRRRRDSCANFQATKPNVFGSLGLLGGFSEFLLNRKAEKREKQKLISEVECEAVLVESETARAPLT